MAGYEVEALESCRAVVEGKAGPVGAIGDGFDNQHVDAAIFGELAASGGLAAAVTDLDSAAKEQFDAASGCCAARAGRSTRCARRRTTSSRPTPGR